MVRGRPHGTPGCYADFPINEKGLKTFCVVFFYFFHFFFFLHLDRYPTVIHAGLRQDACMCIILFSFYNWSQIVAYLKADFIHVFNIAVCVQP